MQEIQHPTPQLRSAPADSPLEQAGSNRQYPVRRPGFERWARVGSPCRNGEGGATRPDFTTTAGVFRGTDGSNPASSSSESGANRDAGSTASGASVMSIG